MKALILVDVEIGHEGPFWGTCGQPFRLLGGRVFSPSPTPPPLGVVLEKSNHLKTHLAVDDGEAPTRIWTRKIRVESEPRTARTSPQLAPAFILTRILRVETLLQSKDP